MELVDSDGDDDESDGEYVGGGGEEFEFEYDHENDGLERLLVGSGNGGGGDDDDGSGLGKTRAELADIRSGRPTFSYHYRSDFDTRAGRKFKDPRTGATYIDHRGTKEDPSRYRSKLGSKPKALRDLHEDPYEEHGMREIPLTEREKSDNLKALDDIAHDPKILRSGYVQHAASEVVGETEARPLLDAQEVVSMTSAREWTDSTDPFFLFEDTLKGLVRSSMYLLSITILLAPKTVARQLGVGVPKVTLSALKGELLMKGAQFSRYDGTPGNDDIEAIFQFITPPDDGEDEQEKPEIEEELLNLEEKMIPSFIEERIKLRVQLKFAGEIREEGRGSRVGEGGMDDDYEYEFMSYFFALE